MATHSRRNRRTFLASLGKSGAAVAVLGLSACGTSDKASETTSPSPGENGTGRNDTDEAASGGSDESLQWERVNLGFVSAYVLGRGNELAVVDTGTEGNAEAIEESIISLGGTWDDVKHVILTHSHGDHVGSVGDVLTNATKATAYAGEADVATITAPKDIEGVADGTEIFGLQVLATPGHTPGHISVFDPDSGLFLAGDAINGNDDGTSVEGPNPEFTPDMELAEESVKTIPADMIETILFGHGEPVVEEAGTKLTELIGSL